ncbi:tail fiber domain-containing protein [Serratia nevei]|uniref:tail fiber domain-containing protein n=1 Tax=Serratia nevei TaxID=2703794 RepID=UPI00313D940B
MPAGTLTLTNNSAVVKGTGTAFNTELKAGDFIVSVVGGVTYTLPIKTVDSATQATLIKAYDGPTQAGAAWYAVPRDAMNTITAQLAAETAKALRGLNLDKANWQQVFSGTGNIMVTLPDGSTYTGPAWNSFTSGLDNKAAKGVNNDITQLKALSTAITVEQGGTGAKDAADARKGLGLGNSSTRNVGSVAGTVAAGDDTRLGTVNNKSGGTISSYTKIIGGVESNVSAAPNSFWTTGFTAINTNISGSVGQLKIGGMLVSQLGGDGNWQANLSFRELVGSKVYACLSVKANTQTADYEFSPNGSATAPGTWVNNSDERLKHNVKRIQEPLRIMPGIKGVTWQRLDGVNPGIGFIAQDVNKYFPDNVFHSGDRKLLDGTVVKDVLSPDTAGISAALHHEAILELMSILKGGLKTIASVTSDEIAASALNALASRIPDADIER